MKIAKSQLIKIIKEEFANVLENTDDSSGPDNIEQAHVDRMYNAAIKAISNKKYREAYEYFMAAYNTEKIPTFIYNAARSLHKLGRLLAADQLYKKYLSLKDIDQHYKKRVLKYRKDIAMSLSPMQAYIRRHEDILGALPKEERKKKLQQIRDYFSKEPVVKPKRPAGEIYKPVRPIK